MLTLVPCNHYWLAVHYSNTLGNVIAICNRCKKNCKVTPEDWQTMKDEGIALDKPTRV